MTSTTYSSNFFTKTMDQEEEAMDQEEKVNVCAWCGRSNPPLYEARTQPFAGGMDCFVVSTCCEDDVRRVPRSRLTEVRARSAQQIEFAKRGELSLGDWRTWWEQFELVEDLPSK
jgi:hypothetical protein